MSGIHGYSSPTPDHVFFSISDDRADWFKVVRDVVIQDEHILRFWGCYKGVHEVSYCVPAELFWMILRTWPHLFSDQESVLFLGTPQARNWRPAKLLMLKTGEYVDIGTWRSATRTEAIKSGNYTHCPERNLYWVCEVDPPANEWERKERAKKVAVEKAVSFLNRLTLPHEDHMRMLQVRKDLVDNF